LEWIVPLSVVAIMLGLTGALSVQAQSFTLLGYENMTGPGDAHLLLRIDSIPENWSNSSLRLEIAGPTTGTLILPGVRPENDLGYFSLAAGNYTVDIYVLERPGPTLQESGGVLSHGEVTFSVPHAPQPPEKKKTLIDPVDLGFMVTALVVFGLVLAIVQTNRPPRGQQPGGEGA